MIKSTFSTPTLSVTIADRSVSSLITDPGSGPMILISGNILYSSTFSGSEQ